MQVLLKKDVPHLGQSGDIKNVKNGYARNYLIPHDLVIVADAKTKKEQSFIHQVQKQKVEKRKKQAIERSEQLKDISVEIKAKIGKEGKLFGSVTNIDIHKVLVKKLKDIERRMIQLSEPIKTIGVFTVPVKLYQDVIIPVKVIVSDEKGNKVIEESESPKETNIQEEEKKRRINNKERRR